MDGETDGLAYCLGNVAKTLLATFVKCDLSHNATNVATKMRKNINIFKRKSLQITYARKYKCDISRFSNAVNHQKQGNTINSKTFCVEFKKRVIVEHESTFVVPLWM